MQPSTNYLLTQAGRGESPPISRVVYVDPDKVRWGFRHPVHATQDDARRLGCSCIIRVKMKHRKPGRP